MSAGEEAFMSRVEQHGPEAALAKEATMADVGDEITNPRMGMRGGVASVAVHTVATVGPVTAPEKPLSLMFRVSQPERDVLRLQCRIDHVDQVITQLVQIRLLAQPGAESFQCLGGVVLPAVEAAVD